MRSQSDTQISAPSLARRTDLVQRSPIRRMFDLAQDHDSDDLIHLEIGEPDFDTPSHITETATAAVKDGATHYTSNAGIPELRAAITDDIAPGYEYNPDTEIIVTGGAMEALALAALTLVDPGDEVLVPTPAWPNYQTHAVMGGGEFVELPLDSADGFALDADRIVEAITDDTAIVLLGTPSNPTGQVYSAEATARVVAAAAEHNAYVVADEVYKDLTYVDNAKSIASSTNYPEHVITIGSCSKTYAMTGWRVGWFAAAPSVVDAAIKFHESTVACAPAASQHAALAALTGDQTPIREMFDAFCDRRDFVVERVADLPSISCPRPEGAFYAFLDCSAVDTDSMELAERLLNDHGIVTAPGIGFGSHVDDHLRISFANDKARIAEGFDRIERFLAAEGIQ
jgi:aspartate aminotransferase